MSKFLMILTALTLGQAAVASGNIDCKVSEVLNGDFEDVYDFTFSDYPYVTYEVETNYGPTLSIGAMSFAENDDALPADLTVTKTAGKIEIVAKSEQSDEVVKLTIEGKVGLVESNSGEGALIPIARVTCD